MLRNIGNTYIHSYLLTGANFITLRSWGLMPGFAAAAEVLPRLKCQPSLVGISALWTSLSTNLQHESAAVCSAHTSLAATMRNLLWPHARAIGNSTDQKTGGWLRGILEQSNNNLGHVSHMVMCLLEVVNALDQSTESCSSSGSDGSSNSSSDRRRSAQNLLPHQLQAVALVTVMQLGVLGVQCVPRYVADWLRLVRVGLDDLVNPSLKATMLPMLSLTFMSHTSSLSRVCSIWEQYAVTHFCGRLVPGCCYLGCTNFLGVSEAALKTYLCSGCRRARYCSLDCQRAAWLGGGHSLVCSIK